MRIGMQNAMRERADFKCEWVVSPKGERGRYLFLALAGSSQGVSHLAETTGGE